MISNNYFKYSFVIIFQKGEIELKSLFLVLSLKKFSNCNYEIIGAIPDMYGRIEYPNDLSIKILDKLGVKIEYIKNTFCHDRSVEIIGDKHANKLFALNLPLSSDKIIFLDSDMLCLSNFSHKEYFVNNPFLAKQVDVANVTRWPAIYDIFNMPLPDHKIPCTVDNKLLPPYFNAGFIALDTKISSDFSNECIEVFKKLSHPEILSRRLFNPVFRDQISISIAIQKLKIPIATIDESYNYPIRHKHFFKRLPILVHYHDPITVFNNKLLYKEFINYINSDSELKGVITNFPNWEKLFAKKRIVGEIKKYELSIRKRLNKIKNKKSII
ncbi:hypothetical protein ES705_14371 [subsurface metagenome]